MGRRRRIAVAIDGDYGVMRDVPESRVISGHALSDRPSGRLVGDDPVDVVYREADRVEDLVQSAKAYRRWLLLDRRENGWTSGPQGHAVHGIGKAKAAVSRQRS